MYWHERMTLLVPQELVEHVFPFLPVFEAQVAQVN